MINQFSFKKQILLFSILFVATFNAQSIEDGVNFYFGQKYDSAKEIFQKNDNGDAVYWLGQVMIAQRASNDDVRKLYQEGLVKFPKSKLIKIGLSHVDILDGKLVEAKAIESAILEGSKNPDEYNAVARAHIQAGKKGDQGFVIEKLKPIYENNKKKDIYIPLYLANAYLYKKNTSDATYCFVTANELDPANPLPLYKRGIMYNFETDPENETKYVNYLSQALAKDPKFLPALYDLFYYNFKKGSKAKAMEYFEKYKANADKNKDLEYTIANVDYNSGNLQNAITNSEKVIARDGENIDPRFYKILSRSYIESGNTAKGAEYLKKFLSKVKKEDISYGDYLEVAKISNKMKDETSQKDALNTALEMAKEKGEKYYVSKDAIALYKPIVDSLELAKADEATILKPYRTELAKWYEVYYYNFHKPTNVDLYNFGLQNIMIDNWAKVSEAFTLYSTKYPDQVIGFFNIAEANLEGGLNNQEVAGLNYNKVVEVGMANTVDNGYYLTKALSRLIGYDLKRNDITKAKERAAQILSYDPTNASALALMKK